MMNTKNFFLCLLMAFSVIPLAAQERDDRVEQLYEKAYAEYGNGKFDLSERHTLAFISEADGMLKKSAYRLLALCRLERGDLEGARRYVAALLQYDPYFTPSLGDPRRFVDLIEEKKKEETGITTASRLKETVDEAPVPVTLITEEMIRHSGAQTLQELLCLYVPGMTLADGIETNIAMHGVYSLTQEKILFLLDGHRMNSYSTNAEAPDFRTSLDKIQHIEVLRGPASSLYGNIALTAVVNIITRKGASLNGGKVSASVGSQNTYNGSLLLGGGNNVVDILGWGSLHYSEGFRHEIPNDLGGTSVLYAHGFRDRPAYDVGLKGHWRDFTFTITSQRSKEVPYVNVLQASASQTIEYETGPEGVNVPVLYPKENVYNANQNYNYDRYVPVDGDKPGVSRRNDNVNIDYSHSFVAVDVQASAFVSVESTNLYNVFGDSVSTSLAGMFTNMLGKEGNVLPRTRGSYIQVSWENNTFGGQANVMTDYKLLGRGSILFGLQYEHFSLNSGVLRTGGDYSAQRVHSSDSIFADGKEDSYSAYIQLKHYFTPKLILNAGVRYDYKTRFCGSSLDHLSPRMSLIYKPTPYLSTRLSYNYSFVDAPYLYRACLLPILTGGENLRPESMDGIQFGATYHKPGSRFIAEMSGFYNALRDIVMVDITMPDDYIFVNSANIYQLGVEGSAQYSSRHLLLHANATWQRVVRNEFKTHESDGVRSIQQNYMIHKGNTIGTPEFITNITAAYRPYIGKGKGLFNGGSLWLRGTLSAQTATYYKNIDMMSSYARVEECSQVYKVKPQCTIGLGLTYEWRCLDIDVSVKNLTNNEYCIGSALMFGVPRQGRQLLAKATVRF